MVADEIALDDERRLRVVLPDGYHNSDRSYPIVYVLDERWSLGQVSECALMLGIERAMPKVICVGVGYEDKKLSALSERRASDYTPTDWPYPDFDGVKGTLPAGRATRTLDWLINELAPMVESRYRADSSDRTLFGHSFSALCGAWCLLTKPGFFNRYLLASPSAWWGDEVILQMEVPNPVEGDRVFVSVGELEKDSVADIYGAVHRFGQRLADSGYEVEVMALEGETHHSTIGAAVSHGLRSVFGN